MAHIDKFIDVLHRIRADHLEVAPGARATLGVEGARRPITAQPVTRDQVDHLLDELLTGRSGDERVDPRPFTYQAPGGTVQVEIDRSGGTTRLLIRPVADVGHEPQTRIRNVSEDGNSSDSAGTAGDAASTEPAGVRASDSEGRSKMESLFKKMVEADCSDLHISTGSPPLFRKDGDIVALGEQAALEGEEAREMLLSIAPPNKQEEFERLRDVDFAYEIPEVARFRCNLFLDRRGAGGVFRFIPSGVRTVEDLRLPQEIVDLCGLRSGLVLVTGPTGSGKSTTLAALVDYINRTRADHVITIEDPIEFVHPNKRCLINQREVGVHTQGFKVALRAALREDPDVVLVGEMRDLETVAIAIETAETGHLVFGTLHTRTAASTVDRIIDQFPAEQQSQIRTMLAESLRGVISQTLLKAKHGSRVAAMEILLVNQAVANLIREGKTYQIPSVLQTNRGKGMQSLNDSLLRLVKDGVVTPQAAYAAGADKPELKGQLQRNGIHLPEPEGAQGPQAL